MRRIKSTRLIDNLQQLAIDIHDFILDDDNQNYILKLLTGIDIVPKNNAIAPINILQLISDYFVNYSWEVDSVNVIVLREFIKHLPQPQYKEALMNAQTSFNTELNLEMMVRVKDLFLLKALSTLKDHNSINKQKLKDALLDMFLRKKF